MTQGPINPDPEQQHADNVASRRQSHTGPRPADPERGAVETAEETDESGTERGGSDGDSDPGDPNG